MVCMLSTNIGLCNRLQGVQGLVQSMGQEKKRPMALPRSFAEKMSVIVLKFLLNKRVNKGKYI